MKRIETICDRCGKEITKPNFPFIKLFKTIKAISFLGYGCFDYSEEKFELCSKCSDDFETFMKGRKADEKINDAKR